MKSIITSGLVLSTFLFITSTASAQFWGTQSQYGNQYCYPYLSQPYYDYHHIQYDRFPGGTPVPKDYTYDPYPHYRAYTYRHPPYYGGVGFYNGNRWYGDNWGQFTERMDFFYY